EEMRGDVFAAEDAIDSVILRLRAIAEYQDLFDQAFGGGQSINATNLSRALASFQRSLVANNSPFDRYVAGEANAMSPQAIEGFERFVEVGCASCHSGPMFSDFETHVLGVPDNNKLAQSDAGQNGTYAFRTPTLRNVGITGPYFHSGRAGDLEEVLDFYIRIQGNGNGPGGPPGSLPINPNAGELAEELEDLRLRPQDIDDIEAFLNALTDPDFDDRAPIRVPSGLPVGGNISQ
ncbi:MAG: cytochrome c peroxidase, partial [Bacteroidota bacterium]